MRCDTFAASHSTSLPCRTHAHSSHAVAVIGEVCSAATVAAAGVSTSSKLPLISPAATSPALSGNDYFFRTVPSDKFQGKAAADLLTGRGYRNIAIVYEDAAYGYGLAFNFIAAFTKGGCSVWWHRFDTRVVRSNVECATNYSCIGCRNQSCDVNQPADQRACLCLWCCGVLCVCRGRQRACCADV